MIFDRFEESQPKSLGSVLVASVRQPEATHFLLRTGMVLVQVLALVGLFGAFRPGARAQERPYFITYNHQMEEPGSLEISINPVFGTQRDRGNFLASWTEFEYGVKGWWTTEFYLDGQTTRHDSTVFTGFRWENRFHPLLREHWINPVLYVEFEDINAADKTLLEVVGHDVEADHAVPNSETRRDREREMETKLILSSNFMDWNISENVIAEKNLSNAIAWGSAGKDARLLSRLRHFLSRADESDRKLLMFPFRFRARRSRGIARSDIQACGGLQSRCLQLLPVERASNCRGMAWDEKRMAGKMFDGTVATNSPNCGGDTGLRH